MGQIKWYKRDPSAALGGMMGLTLDERGAYNTVLDLIYSRDGNLPDDDRFLAGWMSVDVRVWRRLKQRLIDLGKLYIEDGLIHNDKADAVVLEALARVGSARDAGLSSGRTRAIKSGNSSAKNSNLGRTVVATENEIQFELTREERKREERKTLEPDGSMGKSAKADPPPLKLVSPEPDDLDERKLKPEHVVETWNATAKSLAKPMVRDLTPTRRQALRSRIAQYSIEDFIVVFGKVRDSPFLRGETGWTGCTFDWIIKKANFQKIIEGNYDHQSTFARR